jgi:hypothetical protein
MSNAIHINLTGTALQLPRSLPTKDELSSFQNQLLCYRLLNRDKVKASKFHCPGLQHFSVVADALGAVIVDDAKLQREVIDVLKDRDEQSRVDRATGENGVVLRAVLHHCHQQQDKVFVREIAETANQFYLDDGEPTKLSSEKVGHALKNLGLYTHRLGNAGRGLVFDKATQSQAHRLADTYDVLTAASTCTYCQRSQPQQSEEVVQEV